MESSTATNDKKRKLATRDAITSGFDEYFETRRVEREQRKVAGRIEIAQLQQELDAWPQAWMQLPDIMDPSSPENEAAMAEAAESEDGCKYSQWIAHYEAQPLRLLIRRQTLQHRIEMLRNELAEDDTKPDSAKKLE